MNLSFKVTQPPAHRPCMRKVTFSRSGRDFVNNRQNLRNGQKAFHLILELKLTICFIDVFSKKAEFPVCCSNKADFPSDLLWLQSFPW